MQLELNPLDEVRDVVFPAHHLVVIRLMLPSPRAHTRGSSWRLCSAEGWRRRVFSRRTSTDRSRRGWIRVIDGGQGVGGCAPNGNRPLVCVVRRAGDLLDRRKRSGRAANQDGAMHGNALERA